MAKPAKKYTPKTEAQIKAEVLALKEIKPKVRHHSAFGDDNHAKIDAEVKVLEDDMDEDAIYEEWPDEEGENPPELDSALHARRWMDGEEDEGLAESWEPATRSGK